MRQRHPVVERVRKHSKSSGGSLSVLVVIAEWSEDDGYSFPGNKLIQQDAHISKKQVERNIRALEHSGDLYVERGRGRGHFDRFLVTSGLAAGQISERLVARFSLPEASACAAAAEILGLQKATYTSPDEGVKGDISGLEEEIKGVILSPNGDKRRHVEPEKGDILSPSGSQKATYTSPDEGVKGDISGLPPIPPLKEADYLLEPVGETRARAHEGDSGAAGGVGSESNLSPAEMNPLTRAVAEVSKVDLDRCTDARFERVIQTCEKVRAQKGNFGKSDEVIAARVRHFLAYFRTKGYRDPVPTLSQLVDEWPKFEDWERNPPKRARANGTPADPDAWRDRVRAEVERMLPHIREPDRQEALRGLLSDLGEMSVEQFQARRTSLDEIGIELG